MHFSNVCYKQTVCIKLTFHATHSLLIRNSNYFWPESRICKIMSAFMGRRLRPTVLLLCYNETLYQKDVFNMNRKQCYLQVMLNTTYRIFITVHKPGKKLFHETYCIPDKCKAVLSVSRHHSSTSHFSTPPPHTLSGTKWFRNDFYLKDQILVLIQPLA